MATAGKKKDLNDCFVVCGPSIVSHSTAALLRVTLASAGRWCYCCLDLENDKMEAPYL
jgi:hypothetical protein